MGILHKLVISAVIGAGVILFCTLVEQIAAIERYPLLSRVSGIAMNMVLFVLTPLFAWPIAGLLDFVGIAPAITIPLWAWLSPLGAAGYALQTLFLIALSDFLIYWRHRAEHKWFWPIHAVHHSPTELHAANDIGHPAQVWAHLLFVSVPLSLIQFDRPIAPSMAGVLVMLLSYLIHSPIDVHFGPFRKVLVDNRFHRIHHSIEPRHFDKNFGICFSVWDRLFGTAYDPAPGEWPKVGIAESAPPRHVGELLLMPWRMFRMRLRQKPSAAESPAGWVSRKSFSQPS